jgi:hypothetical protein
MRGARGVTHPSIAKEFKSQERLEKHSTLWTIDLIGWQDANPYFAGSFWYAAYSTTVICLVPSAQPTDRILSVSTTRLVVVL